MMMPDPYAPSVSLALSRAAVATGVELALLRAVAWIESRGKPGAVGPLTRNGGKAKGLMQLLDSVVKEQKISDPFDAGQNALGAARMLARLRRKYGGSIEHALAAYNWGPGNVDKALSRGEAFPLQVQRYVERVKARWAQEDADGGQEADPLAGTTLTDVGSAGQCSRSCPVHCSAGGKADDDDG